MNCFIIDHLRIVADIPGRIGKPVFFPVKRNLENLPDPGDQFSKQHIVHISGQGDCRSRQHASGRRQPSLFLLPPVLQHLPHQRKRKDKGKRSHHRPHEVIRFLDPGKGKTGKKDGVVLAAVIIIQLFPRIPQIFRRHVISPHHRGHKPVIHKFLGTIGLRPESRQIRPQKKESQKETFLRQHQASSGLNHRLLLFHPEQIRQNTDSRCQNAGQISELYDMKRIQKPHDIAGHRNAQHLGKQPSPVRKPGEDPGCERPEPQPQRQQHNPPAQKRNYIFSQKKPGGKEQNRQNTAVEQIIFLHDTPHLIYVIIFIYPSKIVLYAEFAVKNRNQKRLPPDRRKRMQAPASAFFCLSWRPGLLLFFSKTHF